MKIRDIVNRDIVNLKNCDQEPIHIPGSIQPHGFLLALRDDLTIEYCSGNLQDFTPYSYQQLLEKNIVSLLNPGQMTIFSNFVQRSAGQLSAPLILPLFGNNFHCSVHKSDRHWIAEFEPVQNSLPELSTVYDQTVQFVKYMEDAATLQALCERVAREIQLLTGYDRVMVYRFDKEYNGEVYAECKREDLESFLGLHYPHTDIPAQARQLYIRNLLRIIVDVDYNPVPIYTTDDVAGKNIDLSLSVLRSTSPIHVQYLQNMGVGATLTISLIHEGKLWGLIACHHYSPKYIDHYVRINAQLQAHFLTSQIRMRQAAEEFVLAKEVNLSLEQMLNTSFSTDRSSIQQIIQEPALLRLCNAAGVAIIMDGDIYQSGNTPSVEETRKIANWAGLFGNKRMYSTSKLVNDFPAAADFCSAAAGVIFCSISSLQDSCILWFNPETLEEVRWAGDPAKAIEKNENGLSPRKSFEAWKVVNKCQAREWREAELISATNYAHALQKQITFILLNEEEQRQNILSEQLRDSNAELENINWISTHDLREPLRKIQIFSSKLLMNEDDFSKDTVNIIKKMSDATGRMQRLIDSLSVYARTRQSTDVFKEVDLSQKLTSIINELEDEINEKQATVTISDLPVIKGIPILLRQLFVNLINNALKFSKKDVLPVIQVTGHKMPVLVNRIDQQLFHKIIVQDNGIGFDAEMNEVVFKVFSRLNPVKAYEGSGIGLALCKKVMQIHHGYIEADGVKEKGSRFTLFFPVDALPNV